MTVRHLVAALVVVAIAMTPADVGVVPITCDVLVTTADGQAVAGLSPADVEVLSDGSPVTVSAFSPAPSRVSVVLLIDTTLSQPLRRSEFVTAIAGHWFPSLLPGDRARIGTIGGGVVLDPWVAGGSPSDLNAIRAVVYRSGIDPSPLWDAVDLAVQALAGESGGKGVLLISDGRTNANLLGLDDIIARAAAADVSVSSVSEGGERLLPQGADPAARIRPDASLQRLADETGGLYLEDGIARRMLRPKPDAFAYVRELADTPTRPGPLLARIVSSLRQRYRLSFDAPADGQSHRLDVRVRVPGAVVRVKRTYVAGAR